MAHERHQQVRTRFSRSCGYCGVSEADAAGELSVDHYHPLSVGGDESDDNLIYCCARCNLYKGHFWPDAEDLEEQRRVLHPLRDRMEEHLRLNARTGEVEPLTTTARFHVALLQLNRPALVAHRLQKQLVRLLLEKQELLEGEISQLQTTVKAQERYIAHLRNLFGMPPDSTSDKAGIGPD